MQKMHELETIESDMQYDSSRLMQKSRIPIIDSLQR